MKNSRILALMKFLTLMAIFFLVAIPGYVLRSRNYFKIHFRKHLATKSRRTESPTQRNMSATKSAFRRLGYGSIEIMQKIEAPWPLFEFTYQPRAVICDNETVGMAQGPRWSTIVGVKSHVDKFKRREMIRKTWGSFKFFNGVRLELFFVVGQATTKRQRSELQAEYKRELDILQPDDKNIEKDNGRKALAAMQWVSEHCASHWIYSSADSDVIPNLAELYKHIDDVTAKVNNEIEKTPVMCALGLRNNSRPTRNSKDHDYVSIEVYPLENYPPSCAWGFYLMPVWLSTAIYNVSRNHKYFNIYEVWITGLLRLSLFDSSPTRASDVKCSNDDEYCGILKSDHHVAEYSSVSDEAYEEEWKKTEETFPADQMESAYRRLGIAYMELMQKMESPRPLFNFTITPSEAKCSERATNSTSDPRWSMIVCVKSQADHSDRRDVIRRTWASYKFFRGVRLEVIFVVGKSDNVQEISKLQAEREKHEDILQIDREEIYKDVGYKAMAAMQWSGEHCPSHWIYSSSDDDIVPNLVVLYKEIDNFISASQGRTNLTPILCGYSYRDHSPAVRPPFRNDVVEEVHPLHEYPPFCAGGFYSMPIVLSTAIYNISRHHTYFYNDDVWITGLLRLSLFDSDPVLAKNISCDVTSEFCALWKKDPKYAKHTNGKNVERDWKKIEKKFPKL